MHFQKLFLILPFSWHSLIYYLPCLFPPQLPICWTKLSIPHHPAKRQQNKKNHRPKSMVLVPGWSRGNPGLHFSSSCEFPKCSCWGVPAPNPAGNVYGKLEFIFFFLNIGILLICIAGTHFRMLLSKNLPLHWLSVNEKIPLQNLWQSKGTS